jgi:hypothetical protein
MSTAAPTTIARIATVALLLFAALLIAIPPAQAASGTTQLTIRLVFPEPPPTATRCHLGSIRTPWTMFPSACVQRSTPHRSTQPRPRKRPGGM